jgi:hypothetical protein
MFLTVVIARQVAEIKEHVRHDCLFLRAFRLQAESG